MKDFDLAKLQKSEPPPPPPSTFLHKIMEKKANKQERLKKQSPLWKYLVGRNKRS